MAFAPVAVSANQCMDLYSSPTKVFFDGFDSYITSRLSRLSQKDKTAIRKTLAEIRYQRKMNSAAYDQLSRELVLDANLTKELLSHYDIVAHEIEHAIQVVGANRAAIVFGHLGRLFSPLPSSTRHTIKIEREAIGAEWDFMQTIPLHARAFGLKQIESHPAIHPRFKMLLKESIAKANLPREQYADEVMNTTGYTFQHLIFRELGVKFGFYALLALTGYLYLSDNE